MECRARQIDRGPMSQTADDVRMTHTIEGDCLVLKVLDEGAFEVRILITLKQLKTSRYTPRGSFNEFFELFIFVPIILSLSLNKNNMLIYFLLRLTVGPEVLCS